MNAPAIRSPKYNFVTRLRRVQRRDLIWVGAEDNSRWAIIPQKFPSLRLNDQEHCLVHNKTLICRLREGQGSRDDLVLIGRDGDGTDWLAAPKAPPDIWALYKRESVPGHGPSRLPDSYVNGPTRGTGVERLVAAALVLADIAFETESYLRGRPDFIIPGSRMAVFAHGCYHHAHECKFMHGYGGRMSADQIADIREYDRRVATSLQDAGWRVLTVWECATRQPVVAELPAMLQDAIKSASPEVTISGEPSIAHSQ